MERQGCTVRWQEGGLGKESTQWPQGCMMVADHGWVASWQFREPYVHSVHVSAMSTPCQFPSNAASS